MALSEDLSATAKSEGSAAFKRGDFEAAASLFARAIDLGGPDPHLLHANRSAALAAIGRHAEALVAAEAAVAAGGEGFIKGHYRRAAALAGLQLWADAAHACSRGLAHPNGAGHSQLLQLQLKCAQQQQNRSSSACAESVWRTQEEREVAASEAARKIEVDALERRRKVEKEREERRLAESSRLQSLNAELASQQQLQKEEALRRRRQETETAKQKACSRVHTRSADGVSGTSLSEESAPTSGQLGMSAHESTEAAQARLKVDSWRLKQMPTRQPLVAPRVPAEFTKQYSLLRKDAHALFEYISLIQVTQSPFARHPLRLTPACSHPACRLRPYLQTRDPDGGPTVLRRCDTRAC